MNRQNIWPQLMKYTRNLHGNEQVFCSRCVNFSVDSNYTYKTFFANQWKKKKTTKELKPKYHREFRRFCNICNFNIYAMRFYTAGSHVYLWIWKITCLNFFNRIFFTSLELWIFCIKNEIVENNSVIVLFTKMII